MAVRERVAAVTGAASGIGRATALGLSRQGARVALCDLNTSGLAGVAATIQGTGGQARMVELDVSNQEQATRGIDSIVQIWVGLMCWSTPPALPALDRRAVARCSISPSRTGTVLWTSICSARSTVPRPRRAI